MRQFFAINPELVKSWENLKEHLISTIPILRNAYASNSSQHIYVLSPDGKIMKKDTSTYQLSKGKYFQKLSYFKNLIDYRKSFLYNLKTSKL